MDYKDKLDNQINDLARENKNLRDTNQQLVTSYLNLQNKYSKLKTVYSLVSSKESQFTNLEKEIDKKDKEILDLKEQNLKLKSNFEKYKSEYDIQYEKDVRQMKYFNENNQSKIENTSKLEKLNKLLYYKVLSLEEELREYEEKEKKRMKEKEIEYEKKLSMIKKRMLDFLRKGGIKAKNLSTVQNSLNHKLNKLHDKELMKELEFQSYQIEDLLKQRDHLDRIIDNYKCDIKIHQNVEKSLSEKNKKYSRMIKVLSDKIDSFNYKRINSRSSDIDNNYNLKKHKSYNDFRKIKNLNDNSKKEKTISLTKEYINKNKELESLKMKYDTLKAKLDSIHSKFYNIINLFDEIFEKIYSDQNFDNLKSIYVNVEELKKCEFEQLNSEQKYSLIILIIKYILPFLNNVKISNKYIDKINNIQTVYFGQTSLETTFSPANTKTSLNTREIMKKKICLMKDLNKTRFNKINTSFLFNPTQNYYFLHNSDSIPTLRKSYSLLKL